MLIAMHSQPTLVQARLLTYDGAGEESDFTNDCTSEPFQALLSLARVIYVARTVDAIYG